NTFGAEHQEQWQFAREGYRLFVAAIVARDEFGDLVVEDFPARKFGETTFDVARRGGRIAGEDVAEVALAFNEIAFICEDDEGIPDRGIAVRVVLHGMANDIGDFDEAPVVFVVERPKDTPLHGLQSIREIRYRAIPDDIRGVIEKATVHAAVEREVNLARLEWPGRRGGGHGFGEDVRLAIAVAR